LPRYTARRVLPGTVDEVWTVLAEPERFAEWWPGVEAVDPGRRGLVPGGLWRIDGGPVKASFRRKPEVSGNLLVIEVVSRSKVVFQLMAGRMWVELELEPNEDDAAAATLVIEAPRFSGVGRAFPSEVLSQLAALVRPPHEAE
jgi:uncharacterized protein YndB with AHSA1/START domain